MERLQNTLMVTAGVIVVSCIMVLANAGQAVTKAAAPSPVVVENTPANPVPVFVHGTAKVTGTVSVTNSLQVGLNPTSNTVKLDPVQNTVQVTSTATNPVIVSNIGGAPSQPFQTQLTIPFASAGCPLSATAAFTVPTGQRLIIEYVSVDTSLVTNSTYFYLADMAVHLSTNVNGSLASYDMPILPQGETSNGLTYASHLTGSQQVRLYADGGTSVSALAQTDYCSDIDHVDVSVSGYLVNMP